MNDEIIGVGNRLSERHTELLSQTVYNDEISVFGSYEYLFSISDLCHLISLAKVDIYSKEDLSILIPYLQNEIVNKINFSSEYSGINGDFFSNRLRRLRKDNELGALAELINCGRPRRESTNIAFILLLKEELILLSKEIKELSKIICTKSRESIDIYFSDFTYWHSTQPTSFSHFLSNYLGGIDRQLKLLISIFNILNCSPAGAGSSNGTMLGLDRNYHSDLLGFEGIIEHTKDATWASDTFGSIGNWICLFSGMLCKMSEDLLLLSSEGFRVIQCSDKHSRISVIMPQKRNPFQLTICRGKFLEISAKSNIYLSSISKSSGYPDSRHIFYKELPNDISALRKNIQMIGDVFSSIEINKKLSNKLAFNKNIYASDIVQELQRNYKISDREAHSILSKAITNAENNEKQLDLYYLNDVLKSKGLNLMSETQFNKLINPKYILSRRKEIGSANPIETLHCIDKIEESVALQVQKIIDKNTNLSFLNCEIKRLLS